jgi:hypothetical protein
LVVFGGAVAAAEGAGLDLAAVGGHGEVGDCGVVDRRKAVVFSWLAKFYRLFRLMQT